MRSAADRVLKGHIQCPGHPSKRQDRNIVLSSLHAADVRSVHTAFVGKLFLGPPFRLTGPSEIGANLHERPVFLGHAARMAIDIVYIDRV